jgi:hypothetical protein
MGVLARCGELNARTARKALSAAIVASTFCIEKFSLERLAEIGAADIERRHEEYRKMLEVEPVGVNGDVKGKGVRGGPPSA